MRMLLAGLLLALVVIRVRSEDFKEKWVTRPPVEYEFPHVIYIAIPVAEGFCSGSLIHESWVLTAASCMYQEPQGLINDFQTSLDVYAGVKDSTNLNDTNVQKRRSIKVRFPNEDRNFTYHSPALIKVDRPFQLNRALGVNLIDVSISAFESPDRQLCNTGSYGIPDKRAEETKTTLKKLDLRVYECNCSKEIKEGFPESSVDKWICGQTRGVVGICKEDLGMGMICDGSLQAVSIGLLRFKNIHTCDIEEKTSTVCNQTTNIGLFVDICFYLEWISEFVCNIKPPKKPCKALAATQRENLSFVLVAILSYFVVCRYI